MKYYAIVSLFQGIALSVMELGSITIAYKIYIISTYLKWRKSEFKSIVFDVFYIKIRTFKSMHEKDCYINYHLK